jgi:hypothetical protein
MGTTIALVFRESSGKTHHSPSTSFPCASPQPVQFSVAVVVWSSSTGRGDDMVGSAGFEPAICGAAFLLDSASPPLCATCRSSPGW